MVYSRPADKRPRPQGIETTKLRRQNDVLYSSISALFALLESAYSCAAAGIWACRIRKRPATWRKLSDASRDDLP